MGSALLGVCAVARLFFSFCGAQKGTKRRTSFWFWRELEGDFDWDLESSCFVWDWDWSSLVGGDPWRRPCIVWEWTANNALTIGTIFVCWVPRLERDGLLVVTKSKSDSFSFV